LKDVLIDIFINTLTTCIKLIDTFEP